MALNLNLAGVGTSISELLWAQNVPNLGVPITETAINSPEEEENTEVDVDLQEGIANPSITFLDLQYFVDVGQVPTKQETSVARLL